MGQSPVPIFTLIKLKRMKIINGILSSVLSVIALYLMFIKAQTNQDLIIGFGALLMAIIFICFMIIEEQKEDIEQLRNQLHNRYNNKKNNTYTIKGGDGRTYVGYGDESPAEYQRMLREVKVS